MYRKSRFLVRKNKFWFFSLISILIFLMLALLSLISVRKLIFHIDPLIKGVSQSKLAADIRIELIDKKKAREVRFVTKDGVSLSGLLFLRPSASANLLICHGYRGCKEFLHRFVDFFSNFNILLFDFRAHGQSSGDMTTIGYLESNDVTAAAEFLKTTTNNSSKSNLPLIILGVSMGGAASTKAVERDPTICNALILDSAYADLSAEMAHAVKFKSGLPSFPFLGLMKMIGNWYAGLDVSNLKPYECIRNVKIPVFIIHSSHDQVTPSADALTLYTNAVRAGLRVSLWIAPPCPHPKLHVEHSELYCKKISRFLSKHKIC